MGSRFSSEVIELLLHGNSAEKPLIRYARTLPEMQQIYQLTHNCYVTSGYCAPRPSGMVVHYPDYDHLRETTHLIALIRGKVVGAVSLTEDGPGGFVFDDDFKRECDAIRQEGKKVGTIWRLVVDETHRDGRSVLVQLMKTMHELLLNDKVSTALMIVNPKHESVYQRMVNATVVARRDTSHGLANAPAVLMRFDPQELPPNSAFNSTRNTPSISDLILSSSFLNLYALMKNPCPAF